MSARKAPYHHGNLPEHITRIAWDKLRQNGADALSLRSCARAVGVDPAAVYRHFKSKDDLLKHLANQAFTELTTAMEQAETAHQDTNPKEALVQIGMAYIDYARANPHVFQMMFTVAGRLTGEGLAGASVEGTSAYDVLVGAITRLRPETAIDVSIFTLWSVVHGFAELANAGLGPGPEQITQMSRAICEAAAGTVR